MAVHRDANHHVSNLQGGMAHRSLLHGLGSACSTVAPKARNELLLAGRPEEGRAAGRKKYTTGTGFKKYGENGGDFFDLPEGKWSRPGVRDAQALEA